MKKSTINRVTKPISRKSADQVMEALQYKNIEPGDCLRNANILTSLLKKIKIENHSDLSFANLIKDKINLDRPLGQGGFGSAFLVDIEKKAFLKVFPKKKWEDHEEFVLKVIDLGAGYEKNQSKKYKEYRESMQKELEIANKIKDLDKEEEFFSKIYLTGTANYETSNGKSYDIEVILMKGYRTTLEDYARSSLSTETPEEAIECLDTAIQIGKGIEILHDNGIIHKDIKPQNIFYDSKKKKVYLGDFGSARQLSDYTKEDNSYNYNTVVPTYTPDYSPPEIYLKNKKIGFFTDIYSLGILLLRISIKREQYFKEIMNFMLDTDVKDEMSFRLLKAEKKYNVPKEIIEVIDKATRYSYEDRYHHIDEMLVDLETAKKALSNKFSTPVNQSKKEYQERTLTDYQQTISMAQSPEELGSAINASKNIPNEINELLNDLVDISNNDSFRDLDWKNEIIDINNQKFYETFHRQNDYPTSLCTKNLSKKTIKNLFKEDTLLAAMQDYANLLDFGHIGVQGLNDYMGYIYPYYKDNEDRKYFLVKKNDKFYKVRYF